MHLRQAASLSDLLERRGNVATIAKFAERFGMDIIFLVTSDTCLGQRRNFLPGTRVTGHTLQFLVRTVEQEAGALVMVEIPGAPVARVVAIRTGRSQAALVHVFLGMTADALLGCILEFQTLVTGVALDRKMPPGQRKNRACVVESGLFPGGFFMALLALGALLPGVFIVLLVAAHAIHRQFLPEGPVDVASLAFDLGVLS